MVGAGFNARGGGGVHVGPEREGNEDTSYRTHRSREVGCSASSFRTSPSRPEGDGRLQIFPGEERDARQMVRTTDLSRRKQNKIGPYKTENMCTSCTLQGPKLYLRFSETKSGPKNGGILPGCTVKKLPGGLRVTCVMYS